MPWRVHVLAVNWSPPLAEAAAAGGLSSSRSCIWGEDIAVPNLAGWRRETMPTYPDGAYFEVAPEWVCAVLSPATRRLDRNEKRSLYAREGVLRLWFVDPDDKTLEVFALREGRWVLLAMLADDAPVSQPPFEAITFPLDALWPERARETGPGE